MDSAEVTPGTEALRALLDSRRAEFEALLAKYDATKPQLFGSVARGTARQDSDIDILVDMDPAGGNLLMRAGGLMEEARELFGTDAIDIVPLPLLKGGVSRTALEDAVPL
jgi:uncharacterized protein